MPPGSRRFEGAAAHYLQGRPAYAPALIRRVAEITGLGPRARVLDLGAGPGQLATGFAYFAGEVLAMDPEPEMLAIAASRSEGVLSNLRLRQGGSDDLGPELGAAFGPFRLVSIGRAFHWMDRAETLRRLDRLIEPGGALALFTDLHPEVPENAWVKEFRALREAHIGAERAHWREPGWPRDEAVLLQSPFCRMERIGVIERRQIPAERLTDRALSMSSSSRARIGARVDDLLRDIRALAERSATEGMVTEIVESTALIATRAGC